MPPGRASKITHLVYNISNLESGQNSEEKEIGPELNILENKSGFSNQKVGSRKCPFQDDKFHMIQKFTCFLQALETFHFLTCFQINIIDIIASFDGLSAPT